MKLIILFNLKFKQEKNRLIRILNFHGFKKINETSYFGNLMKEEIEEIKKNISEIENEKGTIFLIPICQKCYNNIEEFGKKITLKEENYKIL